MVIVAILSALAGAVAGWLVCTLIGSQLAGKSLSAELSAEDKQALADVKTSATKVEAYVTTLLHLHISGAAVNVPAVPPVTAVHISTPAAVPIVPIVPAAPATPTKVA